MDYEKQWNPTVQFEVPVVFLILEFQIFCPCVSCIDKRSKTMGDKKGKKIFYF
jgi:hypothetical protein